MKKKHSTHQSSRSSILLHHDSSFFYSDEHHMNIIFDLIVSPEINGFLRKEPTTLTAPYITAPINYLRPHPLISSDCLALDANDFATSFRTVVGNFEEIYLSHLIEGSAEPGRRAFKFILKNKKKS
ncbi:unnamed protein product [Amoebophrya sp. A25]|nr:unnamed protein product [Amoebophrya sp. A25]|eukprot:GSA25T00004482001.1